MHLKQWKSKVITTNQSSVSLGTVGETCFEARLRFFGLENLDLVSEWGLNWFLAKTTETLCRDKAPAASDRPR